MTPGEEGTQLPTTQRGSIYNPNLWAQRPTGLVLLPLTDQVSLLTRYLNFLEI